MFKFLAPRQFFGNSCWICDKNDSLPGLNRWSCQWERFWNHLC